MYLKYGIYVVPVILITALVAWLFLIITRRADRSKNRTLAIGTVIALAIALLVPAIARTLLEKLSLSIFLSVLAAFLLCSIVLALAFILTHAFLRKNEIPADSAPTILETLLTEPAASLEAVQAPFEKPLDSQKIIDTERNTDKIGVEENSNNEEKIRKLLEKALNFKAWGNYNEALANYREILNLTYDKWLVTQIVIEICGLSKQINNMQLIHEILDSGWGNLLDPEIKAEILNNI